MSGNRSITSPKTGTPHYTAVVTFSLCILVTHTSPIFLALSHPFFSLHTFLHVFVALHCPDIPVTCTAPLLVGSVLMRSTAAQHSPPCSVCSAHVLEHCRLLHVTECCTLRRCFNSRLVYQQSDVFRDPVLWACWCAYTRTSDQSFRCLCVSYQL